MSKIGAAPIHIPKGATYAVSPNEVRVKGERGELAVKIPAHLEAHESEGMLSIKATSDDRQTHANWGTTAAHIRNAFRGVTEGFEKVLELEGIGFRAALEGKTLVLSVGFSHPVRFVPPEQVSVTIEKNVIRIRGIDKTIVGEIAAQIRRIKKPEPYQGKGIRYQGEHIRRKAGKKAAGATGAAA